MNDLAITTFETGKLRFDLTPIFTLADDHPFAGQVDEIPMLCYYLSWPGRAVLVDAMAYDLAEIEEIHRLSDYEPPASLLEQMKERRFNPKKVDEVIITHAHFDHYGGLSVERNGKYAPAFPEARIYLGEADWQPEQFDDFDKRTLGLVNERGQLKLVEGDMDLGGGLAIMHLPGETAGHQILRLRYGKQLYYFVGDLYHHALEFVDVGANVNWADEPVMVESKARFMDMAFQGGALVFFSHIEGVYSVVDDDKGGMRWERVE